MAKMFRLIACMIVVLVLVAGFSGLSQNGANKVQAATEVRFPWMNGQTLWPVGVNLAWYSWDQDFLDSGMASNAATIEAQLDTMASQGVHAVRWWIFPDGCNVPVFSGTGKGSLCTGLPTDWVNNMETMVNYAYTKDNIRIYFTFISFDWCYTGRAWAHDDIIDNATVRQSFLDNAVKPILQALGTNPGVMGWDVMNEPEWIVASADNGDPNGSCDNFPLATLKQYVSAMVSYVHTYATQGVSIGSASMKWCGGQYQFWTGMGFDFYDFHWYDWATPYFNPLITSPTALGLDKPCIIGEMMPDPDAASDIAMTHQQILEAIHANGYSGYLPWSWNDSANDCQPYINPSFLNFEAEYPDVNQVLASSAPSPTVSPIGTPKPTITPTVTPTPTITPTATSSRQ